MGSTEYTMSDLMKEVRAENSPSQVLREGEIAEVDFLILGLELEHEQRRFLAEMKDKSRANGRLSSTDIANFDKRRNALAQRLEAFLQHQIVFMPRAVSHRVTTMSNPSTASSDTREIEDTPEDSSPPDAEDLTAYSSAFNAEEVDLLLPSSPLSIANGFASPSLSQIEVRVRVGRIEVHLTEIRRLLRVKSGLNIDKRANSTGQKSGTRSNAVLSDYAKKIDRFTLFYNEERRAALRLDAGGQWQYRLKELLKIDVRAINANAEEDSRDRGDADRRVWREGQRTISWIWKVPRAEDSSSSEQDLLSAEEARLLEGM